MTAIKQVGLTDFLWKTLEPITREPEFIHLDPEIDPYTKASPELRVLRDSCRDLEQRLKTHEKFGGGKSQECLPHACALQKINSEVARVDGACKKIQLVIQDTREIPKRIMRASFSHIRSIIVPMGVFSVLYSEYSGKNMGVFSVLYDEYIRKNQAWFNDRAIVGGISWCWLFDSSVKLVAKSEYSAFEKQEVDRIVVKQLVEEIAALKQKVQGLLPQEESKKEQVEVVVAKV